MALILGLVVIGVAGLFLWQNLQVVTLIFFGGIMTVNLPIAVWVLSFILLGVISSLTLQFLYGFGRSAPGSSSRSSAPMPPSAAPYTPPPPPTYSPPRTDWERPSGEDWDIDAPPDEPTYIKNPAPPEFADEPVKELVKPVEPQRSPETTIQTNTVYSYSYRESKKTDKTTPEPVYDANYRIITPPPVNPSPEPKRDDDDEEWV